MFKRVLITLIVLALALGLVACGNTTSQTTAGTTTAPQQTPAESESEQNEETEKEPAEQSEPAVENKEKIVIGSIQDLTGTASELGKANAWSVEYAVREINKAGGINGRELELHTVDCKNDLNEGINAYRQLVDDHKVVAIIGPPLSNPALGWVEISEEDKVPIVGHFMDEVCTTNPDTGEPYPYMFLAEPSCSIQSFCIAKYAMETLNLSKYATLYNTGNAFAVAHAKPFMEYVKEKGGEIVAEETFTWTDTDYSAQAIKIVQANPEAVFLSDYATQAATAYDALRDAGFEGVIIGANTLALPLPSLVKNPIKDVYFLQNYDMTNPEEPYYEVFQTHMREEGTDYPQANAGFGWDAMQVLVAAMRAANDPTNGEELRDLIEKTDGVEVLTGTITIDPATHRPNNMGMYIADYDEDNQIRVLDYVDYVDLDS